MAPSMPALLATRTVLLNAVAGCALGWLYYRYDLETGMLAHAMFHATLFAATPLIA